MQCLYLDEAASEARDPITSRPIRILGVALLTVFVVGCGGTAPTSSRQTARTARAPGGTASPPARAPSRRSPKASLPAASAPVNACSLLTRHEVSVAFGRPAPAGRHGNAGCTYHAGPVTLIVTATVASAVNRSAVDQALPTPHTKRLTGSGYAGKVTDYIAGSQTGVALIKGRIFLMLVLTDTRGKRRSLDDAVIALAREAARGL
jgi:hypothetical protein